MSTPVSITVGTVILQEAEAGFCQVEGSIDSNHEGYTGTGFANTDNAMGNGIDWKVYLRTEGVYLFRWRYANGASDRPARLLLDGLPAGTELNFPATGGWTNWSEVSMEAELNAGIYDVRLEATGGDGLANIDYLEIAGPEPQAASCEGNNPPRVTIVSPRNGAAFFAETDITIQAEAYDIDGAVAQVVFYRDSIPLGHDDIPPYTYTWKNVTGGLQVLRAQAGDHDGALTASPTVYIFLNSGLYGDTTGDGRVDADDLPEFISRWEQPGDCHEWRVLDANGDCVVNLYEFFLMSRNWLKAEE